MRKTAFRLFLLLTILASVSSGCSRPAQEPQPQEALAGYLDALIGGNSEEAAKYLSSQAPAQAPGRLKEPGSFEAKMVRRALASHVSYDISVSERSEAKAHLTAKIKSPDFQKIALDITARLSTAKFPPGGVAALDFTVDMVNSQVRLYREHGIPMTSAVQNYELVKEGGAWKISGWD